ncbi:MAG: bifunctional riboflavin kinase/FAD synthetase [Peptoniphilus sp.]|nr:bifunctional riboflavin kinase/FAD synthetase [Peptoniphilus sp.]
MEIKSIDINYESKKESIIALGNFDGVHLAHRELLEEVVKTSKETGIKSSILIFENHTKNTIDHKDQRIITSNRKKYQILQDIGIDIVYEIQFTENVMKIDPVDFVLNFLFSNLKIKGIIVGYDYRFGYKASGDTELLKKICSEQDIILKVINPITLDGEIVSSTLIRKLIRDGDIKKANKLLGYEYTMDCEVIHGKKLGSKMGFPTANLNLLSNYVIPKFGVYNSKIKINGRIYKAATNIGKNPTVENSGMRIEASILDFDEKIYGEKLELILLDYIRPELVFDNIKDLFDQINKDINLVKHY